MLRCLNFPTHWTLYGFHLCSITAFILTFHTFQKDTKGFFREQVKVKWKWDYNLDNETPCLHFPRFHMLLWFNRQKKYAEAMLLLNNTYYTRKWQKKWRDYINDAENFRDYFLSFCKSVFTFIMYLFLSISTNFVWVEFVFSFKKWLSDYSN